MFTPYKISFLIVALAALLNAQSIPVETENLARAVVFLYDRSTTDAKVATGFLLGVPAAANAPSQGATFGWAFLVTARHVVDPEWQGCLPEGQTNPTRIEMRLNTKNYKDADPTGTEYVVVNLQQDGRPLWYHHDNDDIDVAVIPLTDYTIAPLADKHWFRIFDDDAGAISLSWFATPKVFNTASIGSSVVTAGLVPELSRAKRNYLTYRFGRISNIFPESIDVPCRLPLHFSHKDRIWAVAANYAPGNSGSPVLLLPIDVIQGNGMVLGQTELRGLIGLVSLGSPGTDFSGITPVSYIFEVIQQIFKENKWPTDALPSYQYAQR